jgi:hypothetical protein
MIVTDANLLLYAYSPSSAQHEKEKNWLERTIAGPEMLGLPWLTILALLRIGTNPRAFPDPLTIAKSRDRWWRTRTSRRSPSSTARRSVRATVRLLAISVASLEQSARIVGPASPRGERLCGCENARIGTWMSRISG